MKANFCQHRTERLDSGGAKHVVMADWQGFLQVFSMHSSYVPCPLLL